jgi:hypothetical protein
VVIIRINNPHNPLFLQPWFAPGEAGGHCPRAHGSPGAGGAHSSAVDVGSPNLVDMINREDRVSQSHLVLSQSEHSPCRSQYHLQLYIRIHLQPRKQTKQLQGVIAHFHCYWTCAWRMKMRWFLFACALALFASFAAASPPCTTTAAGNQFATSYILFILRAVCLLSLSFWYCLLFRPTQYYTDMIR